MKEKFREWEVTVGQIIERGSEYVAAFIVMDICAMLMAAGICSILGTAIGFIVGMAPYWSEMLLGWLVVYMALFCVVMEVCKFDLEQIDELEQLKSMILELQDDDEDDEESEDEEG